MRLGDILIGLAVAAMVLGGCIWFAHVMSGGNW